MAAPSFQFYPDRWFGGTAHLSPAARGIYIDLLGWQWLTEKPIPLSDAARCRIARCLSLDEFLPLWIEIADKFTATGAGYLNAALERGRGEYGAFIESQRVKGRKGARVRWKGKKKGPAKGPANSPAIDRGNSPANGPRMASDLDLDLDLSSRSRDSISDSKDQAETVGSGSLGSVPHPKEDHALRANSHLNGTKCHGNPKALTLIAKEIITDYPAESFSELCAMLKDRAAKARIDYDATIINTAIVNASAALKRKVAAL